MPKSPNTSHHTNTRRLRLCAVLLYLLGALLPSLSHAQHSDQNRPLITQEIHYRVPNAGEVLLVWGVDGWQPLPEAQRPAGTTLEQNTMRTPMVRQGDAFQISLRVPIGATLDYGFLIVKDAQGAEIKPIWDGNGGADYHTVVAQDHPVDVAPASITPGHTQNAEPSIVAQKLRYQTPEAAEVSLVWGIDDWQPLPEAQRPAGTTLEKGIMHTPMQAHGTVFSVDMRVPAGSKIDYRFWIAKRRMVDGPEIDYGVDDKDLNRYLNALHHSDMVLGQVLQKLEQHGLSDSTLVVVVGDHGEAFGRHNQRGHGGSIYEENLRVPLFFIQPRLFNGVSQPKPGGMVDIAPTIMHLLGLPAPAAWQGTSLLNEQRSGCVYFCAPWSDFLIGYRDGDTKVVVNASKNISEVYNLADDPHEQNNLASQSPQLIAEAERHLGAWVQYHDQYMKQLFSQ